MRAAPPVQVLVTRFGVWRAAVGAALALVWLVVAAWTASHAQARGELPGLLVIGAALAAVVVASGLAASLLRVPVFHLRWDGRGWALGSSPPAPGVVDAVAGDLSAAVDLGGWLLLRFVPERPGPRAGLRWLPVQRGGLEPSWHALRCAVHSPRPVAAVAE